MKHITIIGGGASGTLLAVNLLKISGGEPIQINVVEKRKAIGRGVAFSTGLECHLLNVPAAKMSAFPDDPDHFFNWLLDRGSEYQPTDFVPRRLFGEYLRDVLEKAAKDHGSFATLDLIDDEAVDISHDPGSASVVLGSGRILESDHVVLAFGNFLPPHPSVPDLKFTLTEKYVHDVWAPGAFDVVHPNDEVLIIGTGLSMVDVVLRLSGTGHRGKISALSTRGLLPAVHKLGYHYDSFFDEIRGSTRITDVFKAVRRHAAAAENNGSDWRAVIDCLRPHTQEIWINLPTPEKRYFMQHLSRYWNAARHRMPPKASAKIEALASSGQFKVLSGRLRHISVDNEARYLVNFVSDGEQNYLTVDSLINCIGSQSNFAKLDSNLVNNLLSNGMIRCDPVALGLDATADGRLIDISGKPSTVLRTLGTALKGILWETTAIPEIRVQARDLAGDLLDE